MLNAIQRFSFFYVCRRKFREIPMMCKNIYCKEDLLQEDGVLKIRLTIRPGFSL